MNTQRWVGRRSLVLAALGLGLCAAAAGSAGCGGATLGLQRAPSEQVRQTTDVAVKTAMVLEQTPLTDAQKSAMTQLLDALAALQVYVGLPAAPTKMSEVAKIISADAGERAAAAAQAAPASAAVQAQGPGAATPQEVIRAADEGSNWLLDNAATLATALGFGSAAGAISLLRQKKNAVARQLETTAGALQTTVTNIDALQAAQKMPAEFFTMQSAALDQAHKDLIANLQPPPLPPVPAAAPVVALPPA